MQLIQLLRQQKAHDHNRQLMRFVMMPLLSCARAAIVMLQTVQSWIGPSFFFAGAWKISLEALVVKLMPLRGCTKFHVVTIFRDPPGTVRVVGGGSAA